MKWLTGLGRGGHVIVVVELAFEARIAAGPGMQVICSGGDGQNLASAISQAIAGGCRGLLSFGVAGGLDPRLEPGACVVGSAVLSGKRRLPTDHRWSQRLLQAIPNPVHGTLLGVPAPIASAEDKRALFLKTGAVAVDMESHVVATLAAAHGVPMAAIRVVTDPAARTVPSTALAAMRPNGTIDMVAMIRSLMKKPSELSGLLRTALDARAARQTLQHGRRLLGPGLGIPELRTAEAGRPETPSPFAHWRVSGPAHGYARADHRTLQSIE
jgi:hopanoid-associated phosphorylase